jgi:hypothetical protein
VITSNTHIAIRDATANINNLEGLFPFVALHAFGIEEFKLWVLPQPDKRTYGFLHTLAPTNMVFMRGDFVHASGVGTHSREHMHMELFSRTEAGWNRPRSWWNYKSKGPIPTFISRNLRSRLDSLMLLHPTPLQATSS